jgi:GT2 family glycosyltransferase
VPLSALQQVEGFDESFTGYGFEDFDLGRRLSRKGVRLVYCQEAIAYHHNDTLTLGQLCRKKYAEGRSLARLIAKAPEVVAEMDLRPPFSLPPHLLSPRRDGLLKTIAKQLYFTRSSALVLAALSGVVDRSRRQRVLPYLMYCYYWMGVRDGARYLGSSSPGPS